ncbi:unnamed protein product [Ixodes pacificus]
MVVTQSRWLRAAGKAPPTCLSDYDLGQGAGHICECENDEQAVPAQKNAAMKYVSMPARSADCLLPMTSLWGPCPEACGGLLWGPLEPQQFLDGVVAPLIFFETLGCRPQLLQTVLMQLCKGSATLCQALSSARKLHTRPSTQGHQRRQKISKFLAMSCKRTTTTAEAQHTATQTTRHHTVG